MVKKTSVNVKSNLSVSLSPFISTCFTYVRMTTAVEILDESGRYSDAEEDEKLDANKTISPKKIVGYFLFYFITYYICIS